MKNNNILNMLKTSAFTLAEVLITLTIIGVIAAMTIPTLMSRTKDQQTLAKLKKAQSVLANAAKMAIAENGNFDFSSGYNGNNDPATQVKYMFNKIKHNDKCLWNERNGNCTYNTRRYGEFVPLQYIISDDGIVYGNHPYIAGGHTEFEKVVAISVDIDATGSKKGVFYGFYLTEDGTLIPAGHPDKSNPIYSSSSAIKQSSCPEDTKTGNGGYCTYYTLKTGKVRKTKDEWID